MIYNAFITYYKIKAIKNFWLWEYIDFQQKYICVYTYCFLLVGNFNLITILLKQFRKPLANLWKREKHAKVNIYHLSNPLLFNFFSTFILLCFYNILTLFF